MTGNQESFAQNVANGMNQTEAYKASGYTWETMLPETVNQEASRLACSPHISARVQELKDKIIAAIVSKTSWTQEKLIGKAEISYDGAIEAKQYSAANGALKLIGKAAGLLENRSQAPVAVTQVTIVLAVPDIKVVEGEVVKDESATEE